MGHMSLHVYIDQLNTQTLLVEMVTVLTVAEAMVHLERHTTTQPQPHLDEEMGSLPLHNIQQDLVQCVLLNQLNQHILCTDIAIPVAVKYSRFFVMTSNL